MLRCIQNDSAGAAPDISDLLKFIYEPKKNL